MRIYVFLAGINFLKKISRKRSKNEKVEKGDIND